MAESSGEHWVELVVRGDQLTGYVPGEDKQLVPGAQPGGKATVLADGEREEVALTPGDPNSLTGKLGAPAFAKVTAKLQLTVVGKAAAGRFAIG